MDKKAINKKDIKISFILTLLSTLGIVTIVLGQIDIIPDELLETMSKTQIITISIMQSVIMAFLLSFIGLKLSRVVNLNRGLLGGIYSEHKDNQEKYKFNSNNIIISILMGLALSVIITLSDKFLFGPLIPEISNSKFTFDLRYLISAIFYGGIFEEIMLRLFFMSILTFILVKIFARRSKNISSYIYWIAIFITAILFGLGHLPATLMTFNVTSIVIIRMMLLNGLGGVVFGYLYWKKGLEYSMISHIFCHLSTQLILMPILF